MLARPPASGCRGSMAPARQKGSALCQCDVAASCALCYHGRVPGAARGARPGSDAPAV